MTFYNDTLGDTNNDTLDDTYDDTAKQPSPDKVKYRRRKMFYVDNVFDIDDNRLYEDTDITDDKDTIAEIQYWRWNI